MKLKELLKDCSEKNVNILDHDNEMILATMGKDYAVEILGEREVEMFNIRAGHLSIRVKSACYKED